MITTPNISSSDFIVKQDWHGKGDSVLLEKNQVSGIGKNQASGKNQIIDAKVKQIISSSRVELIIAGKTILADTSLLTDNSLLLTRGDTIKLEVTGDGKIKVLISDAPAGEAEHLTDITGTGKIKILKSLPLPIGTGFNEIGRIAAPIMDLLSSDGAGLIKILEPFFDSEKNNIKDTSFYNLKNITGHGYGKITAQDIKTHVLKFISGAESKPDNPVNHLPAHHLKDFSGVIQKFQVLNSHFAESGRYLIPFPVFFNGNLNLGQIFFDTGDKQKDKKKKNQRVITVSLLLNMSNLGALRADLSVLKKDISGMIQVSDEGTCTFIKTMIPDLKRRLNKHDFRVLKMECEVSKAEKFESTALLDDVLYNETNGLNITI